MPNCPFLTLGANLSVFSSWWQIVRFKLLLPNYPVLYCPVPNCPVPNCPKIVRTRREGYPGGWWAKPKPDTKLLPNQGVTEEGFPCFGFLRSIVFQVWGKCRLSLFIAFGFHFEDGNGRQSHQALALTWRDKIEITIWPFSYFESRTRLHIVILVFRDETKTSKNRFSWSSEKKWGWLSREFPGSRILVDLCSLLLEGQRTAFRLHNRLEY